MKSEHTIRVVNTIFNNNITSWYTMYSYILTGILFYIFNRHKLYK